MAVKKDPKFPPTKHYEVIASMVRENNWKFGVEVGVLKGKCFFYLLDHCPNLRLIGVDQWKHNPDSDIPGAETYKSHDMRICSTQVKRKAKDYGGRAIIMHEDFISASKKIEDATQDFVFLDADHTEQGTIEAINVWLPKVRNGGFLMGHDWYYWPSVRSALDKSLPGWKGLEESVWVWECSSGSTLATWRTKGRTAPGLVQGSKDTESK